MVDYQWDVLTLKSQDTEFLNIINVELLFLTSFEKSCSTGSLILTSSNSLTAFNLWDCFGAFLNMFSNGVPSVRDCSRVAGILNSWWPTWVERDREKNMSWQHTLIVCEIDGKKNTRWWLIQAQGQIKTSR